jgi:hypothetical protein
MELFNELCDILEKEDFEKEFEIKMRYFLEFYEFIVK